MKYDIVFSRKLPDLKEEVTHRIGQGWQPIGGVSVAYPATNFGDGMRETFAQAMVKNTQRRKWWKIGRAE